MTIFSKKITLISIFFIISVLSGCAGMASKAQIKLSVKEVEWSSSFAVFNPQAQASLTHWINSLPLRDVRLKLDNSTQYYPQLKHFLLQQGLTHQQLEVFDSNINLPTNNVFIAGIIIERSIPQCPSWRVPNMSDSNVSQSSNFGCASEHNLAIMVADPSDLARGKQLSPASAKRTSNALDRYYGRNVEQAEPEAPAEPLAPTVFNDQ